jgi:hypothetical protein
LLASDTTGRTTSSSAALFLFLLSGSRRIFSPAQQNFDHQKYTSSHLTSKNGHQKIKQM